MGVALQKSYMSVYTSVTKDGAPLLALDVLPPSCRILDAQVHEEVSRHYVQTPEMQPWGIRVLYLSDPTGILWHITDMRQSYPSIASMAGEPDRI